MNEYTMQSPPSSSAPRFPVPPLSHLPPSTAAAAFRFPLPPQLPSSLSLALVPSAPPGSDQHFSPRGGPADMASSDRATMIGRVHLSDIAPYEGALGGEYVRAVEVLSGSLMRYNAVVIELDSKDAAVVRCGLESVRMYFKAKARCDGESNGFGGLGKDRRSYIYRSGRFIEDEELTPPCMGDVFKCLGKVGRAALSVIARHLRLRSDVFNHLLDDTPLPSNEISSSLLIASQSYAPSENSKGASGGGKHAIGEVENGMLTLIASDNPGIQVCDPNGQWYLADMNLVSGGDLLLLTGKSLSHITAGIRPAASYRNGVEFCSRKMSGGRASLAFRLLPRSNAVLDCSPLAAAGHVIPQSFVPISVKQFMDDLSAEEDAVCSHHDNIYQESQNHLISEPSLRSVLSDPLSGTFLEDAMVVSCGHSFGGQMLKKIIEMARCALCDSEIETRALIPNYALRAAATSVRNQDEGRLFRNAALRKRRKEENGDMATETDSVRQSKGVQYPFTVNEKVMIKGNRRTPDKFVGTKALITSQCLNGWYLLKILDSGESVRLQYRSLQKIPSPQDE